MATNYKIDTAATIVVWTGYKVTGKHTGTLKVKEGTLTMDNGILTGATVIMDMTSIKTTDLEGEWAEKLVGHLKSNDFLDVDHYPTSKLVVTRPIPQDSKGNYKVICNLTIKGITKEIKFFANVVETASKVTGSGKMTIDRSEYNMHYGSGSFFDGLGDKTIYDEFDLKLDLVAAK